jgi:hypothetical protein
MARKLYTVSDKVKSNNFFLTFSLSTSHVFRRFVTALTDTATGLHPAQVESHTVSI